MLRVSSRRTLSRSGSWLVTLALVDGAMLLAYGSGGSVTCVDFSADIWQWRWSWWPPGWACRDFFTGRGSPGPISWALVVGTVLLMLAAVVLTARGKCMKPHAPDLPEEEPSLGPSDRDNPASTGTA